MPNHKISALANAKLNLYFDIIGVKSDGYHLLETVMQSIDLSDIVETSLTNNEISVFCTNPNIPQGEKNICHKAAALFFEQTGKKSGAEIRIEKRIPDGAGLGGGSADAAAVLASLNALCGFPLRPEELSALSGQVGADVPFCLSGGISLCKGTGGDIRSLKPFPERVFLVVKPNFACPTADAYKSYDCSPKEPKNGAEDFISAGFGYPERLYNVFEEIYRNPEIARIKETLLGNGALGASLTGSGSAVFGVFSSPENAANCARFFPEYFTSVARPVAKGVIFCAN